ncbi:MAG: MFS transporter [Chloroflexi bacterium]|nr:MFS transporter [Chloroflexota bacterium]
MAREDNLKVGDLSRPLDAASPALPRAAVYGRPGVRQMFTSLQNRNYRWLWAGTVMSFIAMQMQMVARGYLVYEMTGSAKALGMVTMAAGLPMVLVSLFGGVAADRMEKRNLLMAAQAAIGLEILGLAILIATGYVQLWHLMVGSLIGGIAQSFNMPARQALVPELVGEEHLMNAVALNSAGMNLTRVASPAIAGALIGPIGVSGVYFVMVAFFFITVLTLLMLPKIGVSPSYQKRAVLSELADGLRYARQHPVIKGLLILELAFVPMAMQLQLLLPVFALKVFDIGASGLGLLWTFVGIGGLAGSLGVAWLGNFRRKGVLLLSSGTVWGGMMVIFALFSFQGIVPAALAFLLLVGLANMSFSATNNTILMSNADPEKRGRVMSMYMAGFGFQPLLAVPSGAIADAVGAPATILVVGALMCAAVLFVGATRVAIRNA